VPGKPWMQCSVEEATHLTINLPGPVGHLTLPVIRHGTRAGTGNWTWNGSVDKPTLRPSLLTTNGPGGWRCHCWVNDGQAQFLADTTHQFVDQTVDLLDVEFASED